MRTWKILLHLLLTLLLSIGASGVVSAKVASGDQNLTWTGHQAENVFNWLTCQGKSDRSTTGPPECSVVPKKGDHYIPDQPLAKQRVNGQDIPLPLKEAEGRAHTALGSRVGSDGNVYRQSAEFPGNTWPKANGNDVPWSEVHWTNHGRGDHLNPHQHPFIFDGKGWIRQGGNGLPFNQ
jgi:hypothetical protein